MTKKMAVMLVLSIVLTSIPALSWAASPWTEETTYKEKMVGKLKFGLKNTFTGWTAIFKEPVEHYKNHQGAGHVIEGVFSGMSRAVVYTLGGALHLATFPVTNLDVPILDGGVKCPITEKQTEEK